MATQDIRLIMQPDDNEPQTSQERVDNCDKTDYDYKQPDKLPLVDKLCELWHFFKEPIKSGVIVQQHEGNGDGLADTRKRQFSHTSDKTVVADLSGYGSTEVKRRKTALGISMWQNPENLGNTTSPDSHKYSPDTLMPQNRTTQQNYPAEHDAKLRLDGIQLKLQG